ncbi:MAG: adenylosuccinate lyase [Ardenticatenia bacterium]|jgi:adenylosuccinate lyase|nr:MAG: adenylosuccinate lyase [Ardenticatenia bacterium]
MATPNLEHESYVSPFSWRYGSPQMRAIWSEVHKRRLWRRVWLALAEAQCSFGLVTKAQVEDLRAHVEDVDLAYAHQIEAEIQHDLMAELRVFAAQCPLGGAILHLGATSMDIEDNADVLRIRAALDLTVERLREALRALADQIERWADVVCMGFTHLQPAEPTTIGYRLAQYAQDLWLDYQEACHVRDHLRGKGLSGAVGTAASYVQLLGSAEAARAMERQVMQTLGLSAFEVTTQTYPRKQDWRVLNVLAGIAASLYKFAFDLRILQQPALGEWMEPFAARQIGSSAMPFKRNPINAENMDSLARYVATLPRVAWDNAAHSLLERTLDDSANRRVVLPQAFLAVDELLLRTLRLVRELHIDPEASARLLHTYGTFAATERLLMELVKAGADRQHMHEVIRQHSMAAWEALRRGEANPLIQLLSEDSTITVYLPPARVRTLLDATHHIGDAPARARALARGLREALKTTG